MHADFFIFYTGYTIVHSETVFEVYVGACLTPQFFACIPVFCSSTRPYSAWTKLNMAKLGKGLDMTIIWVTHANNTRRL